MVRMKTAVNKILHIEYNNPKQNELLYLIALFFEILAMTIDLTTMKYTYEFINIDLIIKAFRYIGYAIVFIKIINTSYTKNELLLQIAIVAVVGANALVIGRVQFLAFMFVYGMKGLNFDKIIKRICLWVNIALILTVVLAYSGLLQNWSYDIPGRMRASMGYRYPSIATSVMLYAWLTLCYVLKDKLKLWHVLVLQVLNILQFLATDSRTGTAMIAVMLVIFYAIHFFKDKKIDQYFRKILVHSYWISSLISIVCALLYNPDSPIWASLNKFVSNRIVLSMDAMQQYGVHFFGKSIDWVGLSGLGYIYDELPGDYNYVDCSYIRILIDNGIFFFLMIIAGFTIVSWLAERKKNTYLCFALAVVAVYSIIEPRLCQIGYNPFLLTLASVIELQKQNSKDKSDNIESQMII